MIEHPRYEPFEVLGEGAQGLVVRVTDREAPGRALVAKVWKPGSFEPGLLEAEFALLARRRVSGLVRAHDLGRDTKTGAPFLVEDFVAGEDLAEHLAGAARSPEQGTRRLASVLRDTACTLASLHAAGFVHGDIKPAHVRIPIGTNGEPAGAVLLDLGAALQTRDPKASAVALTRAYAAPEVIAGSTPSIASDLYSLGASAWSAATGAPPAALARERSGLHERAPWVPPSLAAIIERLVALHPSDRVKSAEELLSLLSSLHALLVPRSPTDMAYATIFGREEELLEVLRTDAVPSVRWVTGPAGSGKSHLLREAMTRALLLGRTARLIELPTHDQSTVLRLIRYLRGEDEAWPFASVGDGHAPMLLLVDGIEDAPRDLSSALDAYACRMLHARGIAIVVSTRSQRDGALSLGPLDDAAFRALGASLGVTSKADLADLARASEHWPGWAVAARAGMPMKRDAVLARVRSLSDAARELLCIVSLWGGAMPRDACVASCVASSGDASVALGELMAASLLCRRGESDVALTSPALADALAAALSTQERCDHAAELLLSRPPYAVLPMLRVATTTPAPRRHTELLSAAAALAREQGLAAEETDAHLALLLLEEQRTAAHLTRAERLTRDSGRKAAHQRVSDWLWDLAATDASVLSLALRRRAEKLGREGDYTTALRDVEEARARAADRSDTASTGYALATRGAIHLYAGNGALAEEALEEARSVLGTVAEPDAEEMARLDHNLGAALLYRNQPAKAADALMRSLAAKRSLSDLAGVRSCLMNLGIARSKARAWDAAEEALVEATQLATLLGQAGGLAWCWVERAELSLRRGRTEEAARFAAEALARKSALPGGVIADLSLLRAEIALAQGRTALAELALREVSSDTRAEDAGVDARAWLCTSRIGLRTLPVRPRPLARAAARAMRRAQEAHDDELFERARDVLSGIRAHPTNAKSPTNPTTTTTILTKTRAAPMDDTLWVLLPRLTAADSADAAAHLLLAALARETKAERTFLVAHDPAASRDATVWGMDADGLSLDRPAQRVPADLVLAARESEEPIYDGDVDNGVGRGARVALARGSTVIVMEHRFVPGRFDAMEPATLSRWLGLAGVVVLMASRPSANIVSPSPASPASPASPVTGAAPQPRRWSEPTFDDSTVNPKRAVRREFPEIRGQSAALDRALARLDTAIDSELPALVTGETGVGKELFSRAIHDLGPRARGPFVAVNCAAIPDNLFEAELFGHARGAFTGADRARAGLLAKAEGGTLLLDEVGELAPARQASLLRVLESRRYRPVGSDEERAFDVRIVAATNRDLADAVDHGTFRSDLLYRLRVLDIRVPPLRERDGDVPLLARHFLSLAKSQTELTPRALSALSAYGWPGNVRELSHQMQRIAALGLPLCDAMHLSREIRAATPAGAKASPAQRAENEAQSEQAEVLRAMELEGGNITRAAARLGLTRHGLKKKMLRLGLRAKLGVQGSG